MKTRRLGKVLWAVLAVVPWVVTTGGCVRVYRDDRGWRHEEWEEHEREEHREHRGEHHESRLNTSPEIHVAEA
jgi:hypothetical protein